jgi:alkylation response protein AidB-like acyl-CoA dehydrogenase
MAPFAADWDERKHFPADVLRKAAALGFGAMYARPEFGGTGLTRSDALPIVEALAGACTSTAAYLTIHNMCAWMVDTYGGDELRRAYLPSLATMELFSSYCLTEPNAGSDAASLQTRAAKDAGGDYVLNGSKAFISGGGRSDLYLVMARTGGATAAAAAGAAGISAFLVPAGSPGLSFGKQEKKLGWNTQPTAAVFFENVRVPASHRIGEEGHGFRYAMAGLDGGRVSIATCSVGAAQTCFALARDHVRTRSQFGKPLAANQTVGFTLADMATDLVLARSAVRTAAGLLDDKHPLARSYCALAKKVATQSGFDVCNRALQLHGGYGYLRDYPLERFVRDTRVHTILEGTNEIMNVILARGLLKGE